MNKAFTKETDTDDDLEPAAPALPNGFKNYITPAGLKRLKDELQKCRNLNEDYRKQITELEKQIDNLKLSGAILGGDPARSGKGKESIDRLIREIDRCISLMEG